jgi:hypothetical protein
MGCGSSRNPAESIAAVWGTPQSALIDKPFVSPLIATVLDSTGKPVSGAVVTFTAPATGASGNFAGGGNTTTLTTLVDGTTTVNLSANGTAGAYTVTATVAGVSAAANFSLTNESGAPPSITAASGTPQSTAINTAFAEPLVARVTEGSSPVSGAVVTFTPPATGASGTFAGGVSTATTDANGVATSATFTANGTGGVYTVTATVPGAAEAASFNLTNVGAAPPPTTPQFSFYLSGLDAINGGDHFYALAGSVTIDAKGNVVAGEQDYNDGRGFTSPEPLGDTITGGTLTVNATTGQGTLTLTTNNTNLGASGTETLGVQFVNANHALVVQFDGSATSSGSMDLQTLPSLLSGGFAFTATGIDNNSYPISIGGVFSVSGTFLQNGVFDTNDIGNITRGTPLSGKISAPDSFGRGTITNTKAALAINYYIVGPEAIRIIDVDTTDSFVGSAYGQGAGTFDNTSLGSSVFGVEGNFSTLLHYAAAGMFTPTPASGTFLGVGDYNEQGNIISGSSISGSYTISPLVGEITYNGYGYLTIPTGLGGVYSLGIYMIDPNLNLSDPNNTTTGLGGALITDLNGSFSGGTGVLLPQTDTSTASFAGNYAFGAQEFNKLTSGGGEVDFVGQGAVTAGQLSGTGLVSDPYLALGATATDSGVTFSGTATPDKTNVGRYTMNPLNVTLSGGTATPLTTVIYQASGGQLLWLEEDSNSLFLGSLQQQSATPTPLSAAVTVKTKLKH